MRGGWLREEASVSEDQAIDIANVALGEAAGSVGLHAIDGDTFPETLRQPRVFGHDDLLAGRWIVYALPLRPTMVHSSTIVAVDKGSGAVVYKGDAGDAV